MELLVIPGKDKPRVIYDSKTQSGFIGLATTPGNGGPYPLITLGYPIENLPAVLAIAKAGSQLNVLPRAFWARAEKGQFDVLVVFQVKVSYDQLRQMFCIFGFVPMPFQPGDQIEIITTGEFEVKAGVGVEAFFDRLKQRRTFKLSISHGIGSMRQILWTQELTEFTEGLPPDISAL